MKLLREYVRELLAEAAKEPRDLPEADVYVTIVADGPDDVEIFYSNEKGQRFFDHIDDMEGRIAISKPDEPCGGAFEVTSAKATRGWGPLLYDIAMEYATEYGGGLIADRYSVSPEARKVWSYYLRKRKDVKAIQMDSTANTLTSDPNDNCGQETAVYDFGEDLPSKTPWTESPLSKRYVKTGPKSQYATYKLASLNRLVTLED